MGVLQLFIVGAFLSLSFSVLAGPSDTQVGALEFYWPLQRPWYDIYQSEAPCGTNATVSTRVDFPLEGGDIALYIADDVTGLVVRVAYTDEPVSQSNFTTTLFQVGGIRPGQMCYPITTTMTVPAGTNGTIQLEYTSWYDGSSTAQTFYACADVTFQDKSDAGATFSCLNSTTTASVSTNAESANERHGLSTGAKIGIAIGATIGGSVAIAAILFLVLIRRRHITSLVGDGSGKIKRKGQWKQMEDSISLSQWSPTH